MKTALFCLLISLAALIACAAPTPGASEADPILGQWNWISSGMVVDFKADGTATGSHGEKLLWSFLHNPETQRHYRLVWNGGETIDALSLSEDKNTVNITNQKDHAHYVAHRRIEKLP